MKILLITLAALAAVASAHAIGYDVKLSGDLTEISRPTPDAAALAVLDAWSFEFSVDAASEPTTFAELITVLPGSINSFGTFRLFDGGSVFASRALKIFAVVPPEFGASEGWTTQNPANVTTWAWNSIYSATALVLKLEIDGNTRYSYSGTMDMEVSTKAVPDTGSTAALAGLGLFGLLVIRRKLASSCLS